METAMQELKWFVSDGLDNYDEGIRVSQIWNKINELMEKEKQQIAQAWDDHKYNKWGNENTIVDGEHYYNETFKP
jgi:hypothetical protein